MSKLHLLLPVLALVLVSGCISPGAGVTGNGVIIEAFEPDFSSVLSTEKFQLQTKFANRGSVPAKNVKADLINAEPFKPSTTECRVDGTLLAPDPIRGTTGGVKTCLFEVTAPELAKGLSSTYSPILRLRYEYETNVVKSLTILPIADARRLEQQGGALPAETVSSTSSPIGITITTKGPIRVLESNLKVPIEVKVNNVGGGTVCAGSCENKDKWNKLKVKISGLENLKCPSRDIQLFKGQSSTISCEATISAPANQVQKQITVDAEYGYMIEQSTSIKVSGI